MESNSTLPHLAERFIRFFCRESLHEEILGNLEEYQHLNKGKKLRLWMEVLRYLRPTFFKKISTDTNRFNMFIFNPKIAFRNLRKQGANSVINITGFTIGLLCVFFLYFYVSGELSYDTFHKDYDKIYRVLRTSQVNGEGYKIGVTSGPYARALENDYEGVIKATCRALPDDGLVEYNNRQFFEYKLMYVDDNFFRFFSFPLQSGNPETILKESNSVVLTPGSAARYFGQEDPLGKVIMVDERSFIVRGVMDELPTKSHLEFDMVLPIKIFEKSEWMHGWWNNSMTTYAKVENKQDVAYLEEQFNGFMYKYMGDDFEKSNFHMGLILEPLSEVYFNNQTRYDHARHGDLTNIYILSMVALAILFIACFNYVNMAVALSFKRAKEVGIRKILGSHKSRLIAQFLGESLMVILIAVFIGSFLSQLLLPYFNNTFGLQVVYNWTDPYVLLFIFSLIVLVVILSGVYPAVLLSSFKPLRTIKGQLLKGENSVFLRKSLVVAQFVIAIFLISVTFLISIQINYVKNKELGFDQEAIVVIDLNHSEIRQNIETFKDRILASSNTIAATGTSGEPGGFHDAASIDIDGMNNPIRVRTVVSDFDYLKTFDVEVIAGRSFDKTYGSDEEKAIILNKKALEELNLTPESAIGKNVSMPIWFEGKRKIIGIVANYHFQSLKSPIEPLVILPGTRARRLAVKINAGQLDEGLDHISEVWGSMVKGFPLNYTFLDNSLASLYENEQKQHTVFTSFSVISLLLASLGVFGLVSYAAQRRQKEFGIRKVLGASIGQILALISREFVILIAISFLISTPLAWLFLSDWLTEFSYRIVLENYWYIFLISGFVCMVIALSTISFRSFRVAVSNPSESIRYE